MINAIGLFKLVGIDKIKAILAEDELEHFRVHLDGDDWKNPSIVMASDLHEIVDAFECVENASVHELYMAEIQEGVWINRKLQQAINLVEQCQ